MTRIHPITKEAASPEQAKVLESVQAKMGRVPNLLATMNNSPAVANAYLSFSGALAGGSLSPRLREQIALVVGQQNDCDYCLAAHSAIGKMSGLSEDEVLQARQGQASDPKHSTALEFAISLVENRGNASDGELQSLREAGFDDGEIAEIIANVSLNIFTNYFNHVADPAVDFPAASELERV